MLLYCAPTLIAMQGHQQNIDKIHVELGLYSSICYVGSRIGWVMSMREIFKSWMDVEIIMENCPITIPTVHSMSTSPISRCTT